MYALHQLIKIDEMLIKTLIIDAMGFRQWTYMYRFMLISIPN